MSLTLTVKAQVEELPVPSVARKVTEVTPMSKMEPEAGPKIRVIVGEAVQLSVAVALGKVTVAAHCPVVLPTVILPGQVIVGGVTSSKVTVNVQLWVLPAPSVAVN